MVGRVSPRLWVLLLGVLLSGVGNACYADGCGDGNRPSTYQRQPGDSTDSTHFAAQRRFPAAGELEANVGSGELRIERSPQPDLLQVRISSAGADKSLGAYVQDLELTGGKALISICVPSKYHAIVTLLVPDGMKGRSELNVGSGTLAIQPGTLGGNRELNVGSGKLVIFLNGDRDYSSLEVNVGFGKLKDARPGGGSAYTVITRTMSGKGSGRIKGNVGAGEIDLEPAAD